MESIPIAGSSPGPSAFPTPEHRSPRPHAHGVQFYDDDGFLASVVSDFLHEGISAGEPVLVIASPDHRRAFVQALTAQGVDVLRACREGTVGLLDARETLDQFMDGARPDPRRFREIVGTAIDRCVTGRGDRRLRAYGEMVDILWSDGNRLGAHQLESLWNELAATHDFALLCAYRMAGFSRADDAELFERICAQHTHVTPTERIARISPADRLAEISVLEQRACALESEIGRREALERQLRDSVEELRLRESELRDVLENAAEGIHLVGPDGIIEWANRAELELLGYEADEYIGRHIANFHVDRDVIEDLLARLGRGEEVRGYPVQLRHKDGSIRHALLNSNARFENGAFRTTRCFTRDITAIHKAGLEREASLERERAAREVAERSTEEARRALIVAEQANRAKSDFLAIMSHELRTPLNAIGGYAELMELGIHGPTTPLQRESLTRIQRSQRLLLGLVNQVLNYARVESGSVRYSFERKPLHDELSAVEGAIAPQMRSKGIRYVYEPCDPSIPVCADMEKLQQVLMNLLSNAAKFTDRGGTVRLSGAREGDTVIVRVSDTGIGIPPEKAETIFDPFVQVDANFTRTRDGVGLGLAISRDLARGMNGDLELTRSVEGSGTTFTLTLPAG
jgi:PAS domain S-box-containing protein